MKSFTKPQEILNMSRYKVLEDLEKYQDFLYSSGKKVDPLSEHDTLDKAVESVFADMKDAWSIVYEATVNVFCEYDNYSGDLIYHEIHLGTAKTYEDAMSKLPEWIKEFKCGSNEFDEWGDEGNLEINIRDNAESESIKWSRYILDTQTNEVIDDCDVYNTYLYDMMPPIELPNGVNSNDS